MTGRILKSSKRTAENAVALMAGGLAAEERSKTHEDVECSKYKTALHKLVKVKMDGNKTTGTYKTTTPRQGREPVSAK